MKERDMSEQAGHRNRSAESGQYVTDDEAAAHPATTVTEKVTKQVVSVGRSVHYRSYGTPDGEYGSVCRAAIVTEVPGQAPADANLYVSLAVLNPTGLFFDQNIPYSTSLRGGTWHWPERV
jgi:hypothetical protein